MSFANWDIPRDLFSITPITRETIKNFIGRNQLVQTYTRLLKMKTKILVIFEGDIGTGKTSLGNYVRFLDVNFFTTDMEIMSQAHWGSREFLLALQSAVLNTCKKKQEFKALMNDDLFVKILDRNSNIRITNSQGCVQILSVGVNAGKEVSISQPIYLHEQTLIIELNSMIEKIRLIKSSMNAVSFCDIKVIFQLNNLDPGQLPFSEESIIIFLNNIRDLLTTSIEASFLINGATGLQSLIQKSVKRLSPALMFEKITPLSVEELIEALNKRIINGEMHGEIPFERELIENLYQSTSGNFRETLGLMELLANYTDMSEMIINKISMRDCHEYFYHAYKAELNVLAFREGLLTNKGKIIKSLALNRILTLSEISKQTGIKQSNTSLYVTDLEADGIVVKTKSFNLVECKLSPRYHFASMIYFSDFYSK